MRAATLSPSRPFEALLWLGLVLASVVLLATPYYALCWLPAAALLLLLAIGRAPHLAYYAILFLIPFGAYRTLPGPGGGIRIHWVLAFLLTAYLFLRTTVVREPLRRLGSNLWPWLFAFLAVGLLSALVSPFPDTAFYELFRQSIGYVYIALTLAFLTEKGFRRTVPAVIRWSVSLGSLLALLGYYSGSDFFVFAESGGKRALGGTTWSNSLAMTIYIAMPFFAHAAIHAPSVRGRVVALLLVALNLVAMESTKSRLGLLMLLFIAGALCVEYFPRTRLQRLAPLYVIAAAFLIAVPFIVPASYWERLGRATSLADRSMARRATYLIVAKDAFMDRPILGSGPGTFRNIYAGTTYAMSFARDEASLYRLAHNSYVEVAVGTGLIGLVLFLAILVRTLSNFTIARRAFAQAGDWDSVALVSTYRIAFVCFFFYFLAGSGLDNKYLLFLYPASQVALRLSSNGSGRKEDGEDAASPAEVKKVPQ